MTDIGKIAGDYTVKLGIAPSVVGFERFTDAVVLCTMCDGMPTIKYICEKVGETCALGAKTVLREISYAIKTADNICGRIYELLGLRIRPEDVRPKYIISLVAFFIKRKINK